MYSKFGFVFSDQFKDFPGPMGGIHAGLMHAETDWVGFVPCDSPQINTDLVERFCQFVKEDSDILVAHDGDHQQPVFTLYHKRVLPKLTAFLERGEVDDINKEWTFPENKFDYIHIRYMTGTVPDWTEMLKKVQR